MTIEERITHATCAPVETSASTQAKSFVLAVVVIIAAAFASYHNTFSLPFVFDDQPAVVDNTTIRDLSAWSTVLSPPGGGNPVAGRPLLNVTFALNYAMGELDVRGYHAVNLLLHTGTALLLFALTRLTLLGPVLRARFGELALPLAATVAAVWAAHPLNTESVTCVAQRTELLVGFFYVLTLFGVAQSATTARPRTWQLITVGSCLLGMASKEVMATFPLVALLYDRTFHAGTFRDAWRQRRGLYLGLAATWLLLAWLVLRMGGSRGDAAGFGLGVSAWSYALKQCEAIIQYLRLSLWPHPLVLDYGTDVVHSATQVLPQGILLLALLAGTGYALIKRPVLGFLGAWFFIILGPSSSFVPLVAQTMAEHRMYLPLIAVVALVVVGSHRWLGASTMRAWALPVVALAFATVDRNEVYRSELELWRDTVAKRPDNPRAHLCLGIALLKEGRADEAADEFWEVLRCDPTHSTAHNNLARWYAARGQHDEALQHYDLALEGKMDRAEILSNAAESLRELGRLPEAMARAEEALQLRPGLAVAHANLGLALHNSGRELEAIPHYEQALRSAPELATVHNNLGVALTNHGRLDEAETHLELAVQLAPEMAAAHNSLGALLDKRGFKAEAIARFEQALQLKPDFDAARRNLESVRAAKLAAEQ